MDPTPNPADHQQITHADEQPPRITKYRRNPKAIQPADLLVVRADEQLENVYQQIAPVSQIFAVPFAEFTLRDEGLRISFALSAV